MCPEKDALLEDWLQAANAYAGAVLALRDNSQAPKREATRNRLHHDIKEAFANAERAHLAYTVHLTRHGC